MHSWLRMVKYGGHVNPRFFPWPRPLFSVGLMVDLSRNLMHWDSFRSPWRKPRHNAAFITQSMDFINTKPPSPNFFFNLGTLTLRDSQLRSGRSRWDVNLRAHDGRKLRLECHSWWVQALKRSVNWILGKFGYWMLQYINHGKSIGKRDEKRKNWRSLQGQVVLLGEFLYGWLAVR